MYSGQYDKAIARFETVYRLSNKNEDIKLEACLMLAEAYEKKADRLSAINWYKESLTLIKNQEVKEEVNKRIDELSKG
jgi:tetratricopeptide (TPR) repeat protein